MGLWLEAITLEEDEESEFEGIVIVLGTPWIVSLTTERVKYRWVGLGDFLAPDDD